MPMNFDATREFDRDFKRLAKRYRSLDEDLEELKRVLVLFPIGNGRHFATLIETGVIKIVKARLFCGYLKGSSLRVIYAYIEGLEQIEFIELYYKGDDKTEDKGRINQFLKNNSHL